MIRCRSHARGRSLETGAVIVVASQAVLGFCCARGDWTGALTILDNNLAAGLIDKPTYRRQRGVLLTARALELEKFDRDLARESAMEIKLAPTLVPAAVLAASSKARRIRCGVRCASSKPRGWRSRIPILPRPMRM
jgi:uncharacterized membrane-anchored protein